MTKYEMPKPEDYGVEASEYAGQEPEFENKSVMVTTAGRKVVIMQYLKEKGLYVVMNMDDPAGTHSPAYKVSPDKLREIEEDK